MNNDDADTREIEELQTKAAVGMWVSLALMLIFVCVLWGCTLCLLECKFAPEGDEFIEKIGVVSALIGYMEEDVALDVVKMLNESSWVDAGTFGDMFGCLNTLLTGFAFAGLIANMVWEHGNAQVTKKMLEIQERRYHEQKKMILKKELEEAMFKHAEYMHDLAKDIGRDKELKILGEVRDMPELLNRIKNGIIDYRELRNKLDNFRNSLNSFGEMQLTVAAWYDRVTSVDDLTLDERLKDVYIRKLCSMNKRTNIFVIYLVTLFFSGEGDGRYDGLCDFFSTYPDVEKFYETMGYNQSDRDWLAFVLKKRNGKNNVYFQLNNEAFESIIQYAREH